jgi:3-phosphoshikimate 1-carboxyvinyltransferase
VVNALASQPVGRLEGAIRVPGDKSISHRALMIAAMAVGETVISGLLEGEDVMATAAALAALGVASDRGDDGRWRVSGVGIGGLAEPDRVLELGNSGTSARLLMGLLATHPHTSFLTGDASLCRRPMARVAEPIERMGAAVLARTGCRLPLALTGAADPNPIAYELPVPSAQVKSAVLLAALNTPGETTVIETRPSRDHTELMLRAFGADIRIDETASGGREIVLTGQPELEARPVAVPGDPSSAAFPGVAALVVPGSEVTVQGIGLNPSRTGLLKTLSEMGARIDIAETGSGPGERLGDVTFRAGSLRGVDVPAARAPTMIDEYPILAVAASCADGITRMHGLAELRVKESDRLAAIADGLQACGVDARIDGDSLIVEGSGGRPPGGGRIASRLDHRIAMSFLVMGLAARKPVAIDDGTVIDTSFPGFVQSMNGLGAAIAATGDAG